MPRITFSASSLAVLSGLLTTAIALGAAPAPAGAATQRVLRTASAVVPRSKHISLVVRGADCDGPADLCAFFDRYLAAFNARDFDAFRATFADDITVFFDRPLPPERAGRDAVEAVFRRGFAYSHPPAGTPQPPLPPPLVPLDLHLQLYGDIAVISFLVRTPGELARRTVVVRRQSGGWRVVHIHASSADVSGG